MLQRILNDLRLIPYLVLGFEERDTRIFQQTLHFRRRQDKLPFVNDAQLISAGVF